MEFLLAQVVGDDVVPLPEDETRVQKFYAGKTLLVTGGTGSVGKLLVAKILKFCPLVERIYLIVRAKNLNQMGHRQEELFNHPVSKFSTLLWKWLEKMLDYFDCVYLVN